MIKKSTIAYIIFTIALCYIVSPWFFEKKLLFNELLAAIGVILLIFKRFRIGRDAISMYIVLLISWGGLHLLTSLIRMDSIYFYFRNSVIVYSMMAFFIGYYCLKYLGGFIQRIRKLLRWYVGIFLLIRVPRLFERFGMATIFPALFKSANVKWLPHFLICINIVYGISYDSFTALVLACFYLFLFLSPGYKFFSQTVSFGLITGFIIFAYLQPNLALISRHYSDYNYNGILDVMHSHPLLRLDGNSTWRLVLWKQIIVDHFPANIFGLGFGTPVLKYFPVEDYNKLSTLPYVLGAHNSFVYLFGRLGIVFVLLITPVYIIICKEFFYFKSYYRSNNEILLFLSFFAITLIALFNPTLESPIYASAYWLILGFVAKSIQLRKTNYSNPLSPIPIEDPVHT